jgi:hypothetical protein
MRVERLSLYSVSSSAKWPIDLKTLRRKQFGAPFGNIQTVFQQNSWPKRISLRARFLELRRNSGKLAARRNVCGESFEISGANYNWAFTADLIQKPTSR